MTLTRMTLSPADRSVWRLTDEQRTAAGDWEVAHQSVFAELADLDRELARRSLSASQRLALYDGKKLTVELEC